MEKIVVEKNKCHFEYNLNDKSKFEEYLSLFYLLLENNKNYCSNKYRAKFILSVTQNENNYEIQFCQLVKKNDEYDTFMFYEQIKDLNCNCVDNIIKNMNIQIMTYYNSKIIQSIPCKYIQCDPIILELLTCALNIYIQQKKPILSDYIKMKKNNGLTYNILEKPDLYEPSDCIISSSIKNVSSSVGQIIMLANPSTMINPLSQSINLLLVCSYNNTIFKVFKNFSIKDIENQLAIYQTNRKILLSLKGAKLC